MIHQILQIQYEEKQQQELIVEEQGVQYWVVQNTIFTMELKKGEKVKYNKDGEITKIESINDMMQRTKIQSNLDQQKCLRWELEEDISGNRIWKAYWNGKELIAGGICNQNNNKIGQWIDIWEHFWKKSKVFYKGQYLNGNKTGKWDIIMKEQRIGGSQYNDIGQKQGQWIEIGNSFKKNCQVKYYGEYQDDRKIGDWKILYNGTFLGGGIYNKNGLKDGKWLDLYKLFTEHCQVGFIGEYQNGRKINNWKIIYRGYLEIEQTTLDCGNYNENGRKKGRWTELHENYSDNCKVVYIGEYLGGQKEGRWDISQFEKGSVYFKTNVIGGGLYQCGQKIGKWIDLSEKYFVSNCGGCKIIYKGKYFNNLRQDRWNIINNNEIIGGGNYNKNGLKQGKWIDIYENYLDFTQIICIGEYLNRIKQGIWKFLNEDQIIGGGEYDLNGFKSKNWIDLQLNYSKYCQVTFRGEYLNGIKLGKWETYYKNKLIGGGIYDQQGNKEGEWLDLHDNFRDIFQVIYIQNYKNGKIVGTPQEIELN